MKDVFLEGEAEAEQAVEAIERFTNRRLERGIVVGVSYSLRDRCLLFYKEESCTHLIINGEATPIHDSVTPEEIEEWMRKKKVIIRNTLTS